MIWTDDAVESLKRLALQGMSASVIAAALGAESRNAVIGKANRIGIRLGGGRGADRAVAGARVSSASGATPGSPPDFPRRQERPAWTFADAEVGEMRRVRFADVRDSACKWPIGEPGSGDFAFCGLAPAAGRSYCAGHCRIAYRPPGARTRQGPPERGLANSWRLA